VICGLVSEKANSVIIVSSFSQSSLWPNTNLLVTRKCWMKTILSCQFKNTKSIFSLRVIHRICVNSSVQHMSDVRLKLNKARRHSQCRVERQLSLSPSHRGVRRWIWIGMRRCSSWANSAINWAPKQNRALKERRPADRAGGRTASLAIPLGGARLRMCAPGEQPPMWNALPNRLPMFDVFRRSKWLAIANPSPRQSGSAALGCEFS
jgi:hypothetical protein